MGLQCIAHNKAIFQSIVLVLVLIDQTHPSSVVRLSLFPSLKRDLVVLEVSFCFLGFNKSHCYGSRSWQPRGEGGVEGGAWPGPSGERVRLGGIGLIIRRISSDK